MINQMVVSTEIEWIGYEHKTSLLQVEFIAGSIYQYANVPECVYKAFLNAESHGRFFESFIKPAEHSEHDLFGALFILIGEIAIGILVSMSIYLVFAALIQNWDNTTKS